MPVPAGIYMIVPSTFNPQEICKFSLAVYSAVPIDVRKYQ